MAAKTKKTSASLGLFKGLFLGAFTLFLLLVLGQRIYVALRDSGYFAIKDIWYESSLKSIESSELAGLKGKDLFDVDLKKIQRQLQYRYPQYKDLVVLKRFPNQILVTAQKRPSFALVEIQGHSIVVDERGVVLFLSGDPESKLPVVTGVSSAKKKVVVGTIFDSRDLHIALDIIKIFQTEKTLSLYRISRIDVSNLSEINFFILDSVKIVVDQDNFSYKLKMLGLMLSQAKLKAEEVKYIDLRFKEPILGKK